MGLRCSVLRDLPVVRDVALGLLWRAPARPSSFLVLRADRRALFYRPYL